MLNQSFNQDTFQEIFDKENRKGKNVENIFKTEFQPSLDILKTIQAKNVEIKKETDREKKKILYEENKILKRERELLIKETLLLACDNLPKKINDVKLTAGPIIGKQTYILEHKLENYFISKKVQQNIALTYKVKQANRYAILSQLIKLLEDNFPKVIVRTDINSFYENIPQKPLMGKINSDHLLSVLTKRFINKIILEYNILTGQTTSSNPIGIPRGVGISPYLSELYMRMIDNEIKTMPDLVYYSRYVDDILAVFIPNNTIHIDQTEILKYKKELSAVVKKAGLSINAAKTQTFNLIRGIDFIKIRRFEFLDDSIKTIKVFSNPKTIEYLGYKIGTELRIKKYSSTTTKTTSFSKLSIDITDKKFIEYKKKVKAAFDDFKKKRLNNEKNAFKLLRTRIEFLTSNTRLRNNKGNVIIGVYYSNPFLNDDYSLKLLDKYLKWHIDHGGLKSGQKSDLMKLKFTEGYEKRRFILFPLKKELYKNHNLKKGDLVNVNNRGILRYGLREINSIWKKF
ncbi:antiviral reverse transcriptase Drt3a [Allomuricauda sp. M10]|uniref:antiviral reverse transcriptase Drt3a n=1 Tax=Allomuricauda sp. M10 TaxID=2683292 RepID=UPI001D185D45|nr:antiviral reverse transcriptase Drt3a [Muricauda sp. M10]